MTTTIDEALKLADQDCPLPSLAGPALKLLRERVREMEAATLRQPDSGRVGDAISDVVDAAVEAFDDVYDGVSHNKREAIQHAISAALAAQGQGEAVAWRYRHSKSDGGWHDWIYSGDAPRKRYAGSEYQALWVREAAQMPVAWQIRARGRDWEACTKECYDDTLRIGRFMGLPAGTTDVEVRELFTHPAPAASPAGVPVLDAEDWKVLARLRAALPDVGLNGWHRGVTVLDKLLAAARPRSPRVMGVRRERPRDGACQPHRLPRRPDRQECCASRIGKGRMAR